MRHIPIIASPHWSGGCAHLEFKLTRSLRRQALLALGMVALVLSVAGQSELPPWARATFAGVLLAAGCCGAARLLPRAHHASVAALRFDPASQRGGTMQTRICLRDGVERRAMLDRGSVLLPRMALLIFRLDARAAVLGPGQRLPGHVYALLFAAEHDPCAWRILRWHLRWPART